MHYVPSRGVDYRVNLSLMQTLHIPVYSNTCPHQSCVDCRCRRPSQSFKQLISCRWNLLFQRLRFSSNSDCICTKSNLHVSCTECYTGSVLISTEKARRARFEFSHKIRNLATKIARDVSTYCMHLSSIRTLQYIARTKDGAWI